MGEQILNRFVEAEIRSVPYFDKPVLTYGNLRGSNGNWYRDFYVKFTDLKELLFHAEGFVDLGPTRIEILPNGGLKFENAYKSGHSILSREEAHQLLEEVAEWA
jgi:hypothetical protein